MKKLIFSDSIVNFIAAKASDPSFLRQLTSKQEINERCSKLKQSVEKVKRVLSQTKTTCNQAQALYSKEIKQFQLSKQGEEQIDAALGQCQLELEKMHEDRQIRAEEERKALQLSKKQELVQKKLVAQIRHCELKYQEKFSEINQQKMLLCNKVNYLIQASALSNSELSFRRNRKMQLTSLITSVEMFNKVRNNLKDDLKRNRQYLEELTKKVSKEAKKEQGKSYEECLKRLKNCQKKIKASIQSYKKNQYNQICRSLRELSDQYASKAIEISSEQQLNEQSSRMQDIQQKVKLTQIDFEQIRALRRKPQQQLDNDIKEIELQQRLLCLKELQLSNNQRENDQTISMLRDSCAKKDIEIEESKAALKLQKAMK